MQPCLLLDRHVVCHGQNGVDRHAATNEAVIVSNGEHDGLEALSLPCEL